MYDDLFKNKLAVFWSFLDEWCKTLLE